MPNEKNSNTILVAFLGLLSLGLFGTVFLGGSGDNAAEIAHLQSEIDELQERVTVLEKRERRGKAGKRKRGGRPGIAGSLSSSEPEDRMRERIRTRLAEEGVAAGTDPASIEQVGEAIEADPEVRSKITDLVRDELAAERDQRWERRAERRAQRDEERLDQLSSSLDLSTEQREQLSGVMADERETIGSLFRAAREDGSWMEARDQAVTIRAENDARVQELLDDDQYAGWDAMRTEEEERRRR